MTSGQHMIRQCRWTTIILLYVCRMFLESCFNISFRLTVIHFVAVTALDRVDAGLFQCLCLVFRCAQNVFQFAVVCKNHVHVVAAKNTFQFVRQFWHIGKTHSLRFVFFVVLFFSVLEAFEGTANHHKTFAREKIKFFAITIAYQCTSWISISIQYYHVL